MSDVQVPEDLDEAMELLYEDASEEDLEFIKNQDEGEFSGEQHFNAGMWIRNQWFYRPSDSDFQEYLQNLGEKVFPPNPDRLSAAITKVFHRYVRDPGIDPEEEFIKVISG